MSERGVRVRCVSYCVQHPSEVRASAPHLAPPRPAPPSLPARPCRPRTGTLQQQQQQPNPPLPPTHRPSLPPCLPARAPSVYTFPVSLPASLIHASFQMTALPASLIPASPTPGPLPYASLTPASLTLTLPKYLFPLPCFLWSDWRANGSCKLCQELIN